MNRFACLSAFFIAMMPMAQADGPSSDEGVGMVDAFLKVCSEISPDKTPRYRELILKSFDCSREKRSLAELEANLVEQRALTMRHEQSRAAYQRYYDRIMESYANLTRAQKTEMCETWADASC